VAARHGPGSSPDDRDAATHRAKEKIMRLRRLGLVLIGLLLAGAVLAAPTAKATPDAPVDLNNASAAELQSVPGIGKVTAQRIVEWREKHGPFRRAEDLMKVKGIGEKSFDKLRPYVKVGKSR
jgi:comEA protein